MKHKRHQKDKRDKEERNGRTQHHSELLSKREYSTVYKMKDHNDDSSHPKKLIIYIVISNTQKLS